MDWVSTEFPKWNSNTFPGLFKHLNGKIQALPRIDFMVPVFNWDQILIIWLIETLSGCPATSPHKIPWHFPDHFVVFPDHETYYWHFITALTLILQAIWQITQQK